MPPIVFGVAEEISLEGDEGLPGGDGALQVADVDVHGVVGEEVAPERRLDFGASFVRRREVLHHFARVAVLGGVGDVRDHPRDRVLVRTGDEDQNEREDELHLRTLRRRGLTCGATVTSNVSVAMEPVSSVMVSVRTYVPGVSNRICGVGPKAWLKKPQLQT